MSDTQGPGGGALEPHTIHFGGGGFGPPPTTGKHPYSPPTSLSSLSTSNGLTDLSSVHHPHLTLLKSSSSNNHAIGLPPSWLPTTDAEGLGSRLSDAFSEMRYLELNNWDLNSGYPLAEGLTARLVDARSIDSPDQPIQYRPWEKPVSSSSGPTTTASPTTGTSSNTTTTTTNGVSGRNDNVTTTTAQNGVSSTNNSDNENKTPPTLTQLTNAFPNFAEAFVPNGQKLPSFQSQFNSYDQPITGHLAHPLAVTEAPNPGLPSFHTLPANGRYVPTHPAAGQLHPVAAHSGHPHMVAAPMAPPREQQPFLEERHIQLFPGQVPLAPGQFSQLIATSSPATSTMTISNGHHIHSPHHTYHSVMTNGTGTTNGGGAFSGISASCTAPTAVVAPGTTTLQLQELVPVPPMHTILHPSSAAAAAVAAVANSSSTHKLAQPITTDSGLNLNIIDPHHHPHSHAQHPHHFATTNGNNHHLSLNLPKYLTGAPTNDGPIETHLIAVKLPNATYEHVTTQGHPGMLAQHPQSQSLHPPAAVAAPPHHPQHHHPHQITKLEQHQRSPQIIPNGASPAPVNNNNGTTGTPATPKRQGKRKRNETPSNGITNNNTGQLGQHNNHHDSGNNAHQVSSVSSTESNFKRPNLGSNHHGTNGKGINGNSNGSMGDCVDHGLDKPVKKKRKRCGECVGCQRKDNCGECAPCRNDKSHQICKQRRCDKLTEKKTPKSKLKQQQQQQQQLQQHH